MSSGVDASHHDQSSIPTVDNTSIDPDSVSHVFHSSGTSGLPKPIPNTHARSVKVLPRRAPPSYLTSTDNSSSSSDSPSPPSESAAFTTTPLFHGGVSDLLRGWMARSMVYFYPTSDVPITMRNVVAAVQACQDPPPDLPTLPNLTGALLTERENRFNPTAFLCVPYILSTLVEDLEGDGMKMLQSMDYVSTGGAPLDTSIGDAMVERGVRLVSRLGSSECGCESIQLPM
jgi:acyl-CoA synthetase (AMP-forming)/AMP-acid ligase II